MGERAGCDSAGTVQSPVVPCTLGLGWAGLGRFKLAEMARQIEALYDSCERTAYQARMA